MIRLRRLRRTQKLRDAVAQTQVQVSKLILPIFVEYGKNKKEEIPTMPGVYRYTVDRLGEVVRAALQAKILGLMVFGIPETKDEKGSDAADPNGIAARAIRRIKEECRALGEELYVVADICLCEYTSHGHCGVLCGKDVDNDASLPLHAQAALVCAQAGADAVAPSSMMDGVVAAIRGKLDSEGLTNVAIMGYSAKFASAFYGPFRDAADSAPQQGDRKGYQMDFRNGREALREIAADEQEGADFIMVKPALAYLDVARAAREKSLLPLVVYNVSGEYSMVKAAAKAGFLDEKRIVQEILTAFFRAGADLVITYHALEYAKWKENGEV